MKTTTKWFFWVMWLLLSGCLCQGTAMAQQPVRNVPDSVFSWITPATDTILIARQQHAVRWRWQGDPQQRGTLAVQYTGTTTWQPLIENLRLAEQGIWWSPPERNQTARLRIATPTRTYLTDTFVVVRPIRPQVLLNCPDQAVISWARQPGIAAYTLARQGPNGLEPFRQTPDTVANLLPSDGPTVAIWPILNGKPIRLANAIEPHKQGVGCYTTGWAALQPVADTARLHLTLSTTWNLSSLTLERATAATYQPLQTLPILPNQLRYTFADRPPAAGATRYRIRLTPRTGPPVVTADEVVYRVLPTLPFVFPNPVGAGQLLTLTTPNDTMTATWLTPDGRTLQGSAAGGQFGYVLAPMLPPGPYLLRLETRTGEQRVVPVVVR
jgi:hypothetical protein